MNRKLRNIIMIIGVSCLFAGALLTVIYFICGIASLLFTIIGGAV